MKLSNPGGALQGFGHVRASTRQWSMASVLSHNHQKTDDHAKFAIANNDTRLS
jgi:hypothetical protein